MKMKNTNVFDSYNYHKIWLLKNNSYYCDICNLDFNVYNSKHLHIQSVINMLEIYILK